jgi:hypothetical protein
VRIWIKRAVGAAALAGGVLALGSAAQAHAAESSPASRPARAASIDAGACGVVGLGGTQADACASASDAVEVKVRARLAPRASVKATRRLAAKHVRAAAERLHSTVPAIRATAQLGQDAAEVDASASHTGTARAGVAVRRNIASGDASVSHGAIDAGAAVAAATNLGANDGTAGPRPAAAVDLTTGAIGGDTDEGGQLDARAEPDASADLRASTRRHGTTAGARVDANAELGAGKTGSASGNVDSHISTPSKTAGASSADLSATLDTGTAADNTTATTNVGLDTGTAADDTTATTDAGINVGLDTGAMAGGTTGTDPDGRSTSLDTGTSADGTSATTGAGVGLGLGGLRTVLRRGVPRPSGSQVVGSGGVLDGLTAVAPVDVGSNRLGELVSPGDQPITGADPGQAVARGLYAVGATVDRSILGSRSPLALGPAAVPGAEAPASQGSVAARLAAARAWAGITAGAGVAAGGRVPPASVRALSAKPARMLAMTGGHAFLLLWLGVSVLLTGMAALARARSVAW